MEPERYNCLVVDDEPIARRIIAGYIAQLPFLSVAAESINALDAIDRLSRSNDIDIIFLDINMPNLSGLQLVKILQPQQPVIFTTAYAEHAVESYEINAVDYLLKPFSFERFAKAVYKALHVLRDGAAGNPEPANGKSNDIYLKSEGKSHRVPLGEILYCEARRNYTKVVLQNGRTLMVLLALSKLKTQLLEAGGDFVQVHRSFLVGKPHITAIRPNSVSIAAIDLPIGVQFKEQVYRIVGL
ncbi:MAG: response regulator transcription factor [Chitinophagaceae bacterium]|nr:MAG: response regulator transcription factor [Chitinophagaceae bacterium]